VTATATRGVSMVGITLVEMTDYETGGTVYVNPASITRVSEREVKEGVATDVHFVGGEYLIVKEKISEIVKRLGLEPKEEAD